MPGLVTLVLWSSSLLPPPPAEEQPLPERVRQAVRRSLPYLEKEGSAWMSQRKCMSCHQVPFMLWSLNEAQRHGMTIDAGKLAGWNEWGYKNAGGQGGGTHSQFAAIMLATNQSKTQASDKARQTFLDGIVKAQGPNGLWTAAGQFLAQKRPNGESHEVNSMWIVLTLDYLDPLPDAAGKARDRARAALKDAKPGVSTESLLLHLLFANKAGDSERSRSLLQQLLQEQHEDGGWSWVRANAPSDALATGLVLYGLSLLERGVADPNIQKAWQYLLRTQRPDGFWFVGKPTASAMPKKDSEGGDAIYSYWATSWVVLGMLNTLPK